MESAFGVDHGEITKARNPYLWGGQNAAALDAPKGKKKKAYLDAQKTRLGHSAIGAGGGAALGGLATHTKQGAILGGLAGASGAMMASEKTAYNNAKKKGGW